MHKDKNKKIHYLKKYIYSKKDPISSHGFFAFFFSRKLFSIYTFLILNLGRTYFKYICTFIFTSLRFVFFHLILLGGRFSIEN